ncbi:MAG: resolvase [Gammaproteobacteria bacterium GWE2_37_16]|nr:MAG: resolvase [Gammaproteobacteria bacterium GWE2_37_16]
MTTLAYLRVSTDKQDLANQKLAILEYSRKHKIKITQFIEAQVSSRKSAKERKIDYLLKKLAIGDTVIVSELSRLGRSLSQIILLIDEFIKNKIQLIAIKENLIVDGKQSMHNKVIVAMFGLFAEIERDLISERTKHGLQTAISKGKQLGRPKGSLSSSKLSGKEEEIKQLLKLKVSKSSIAKIVGVSRTTLLHFIGSRNIKTY